MKFLHTADWHIGKKLHGFELTEEQDDAYQQIVQIATDEKVDAVVIAGDLYDRAMPSEDSVHQLNHMLVDLNLDRKFPVLAISGNHDSATRLHTGSEWYSATNYFLNTELANAFEPVEMNGTQFFLLPYFEPWQARNVFEDTEIRTVEQAMKRVVAKMQTAFKPDFQHVLVAHFFAAGSSQTESETKVVVGGLNAVPLDLLALFDYVALGHLHNHHALNDEKIRYSGSPVKFSLSEAAEQKGVWIVDTDAHTVTYKEITPLRDVETRTEAFATLMDSTYYDQLDRDNYYGVTLTDRAIIPDVMNQLRTVYPRIVSLDRKYGREDIPTAVQVNPNLDPLTLLEKFFEHVNDEPLSKQQTNWAKTGLNDARKED
ncbi:exonuclease SbcCD subunit D [Furfurilactobacillus siliginis]|uniref:Nuclease SbcCD subunit D n=1 Tax=Furfurilactobacillus siliginis TaxID=348151 RepID=A0A0R2LBV1_9LACO|nr:exonuclease SbcCD subunit D [Furfurilactobacillus siliginis]KRN97269.1 exonuclease SbcD [Furfurilactobacillus siliginis]GEK29152.1 nuclease SbcCD subunit D [Furfurilactobacillus siliginis]